MVRRFVVSLPSEEYRRLQELAEREERIPEQQAAYLLRRVLTAKPAAPARAPQSGAHAAS